MDRGGRGAVTSRIVSARGMIVRCRLPETIGNSRQFFDAWTAFLLQLTTDDGLSGWGEHMLLPQAVSAAVRQRLLPLVMGKDPSAIQPLFRAMERSFGDAERSLAMMAISPVDMALWDVAARSADVPVATLLGGAVRDRVSAYASGPFMRQGSDRYAGYVGEVENYLRAGFRAFKIRAGVNPAADEAVMRSLREAVGGDIAIMLDLNQGYLRETALDLDRRLRGLDVLWIEEPVAPDDLEGYRFLAKEMQAPIAGGEALADHETFAAFFQPPTFDVVQPDLSVCGGFTGFSAVMAMTDADVLPLVAHTFGTVVNFYASLQLAATLPERRIDGGRKYPLFEYDPNRNDMRAKFAYVPVDSDGAVAIPDGPGIGIDIDAAAFEPFVVEQWEERV